MKTVWINIYIDEEGLYWTGYVFNSEIEARKETDNPAEMGFMSGRKYVTTISAEVDQKEGKE